MARRTPCIPVIGCAGWSLGRMHDGLMGEGDSMLERYATRLDAVEINSSFYRPHRQATYARWAASVPRTFRFSVKMPREISHELGLRGATAALDRFLDETAGLGTRLGGFLLQLPPGLPFDLRSASAFFRALRRRSSAPLACEPRHASWFDEAAEALFERHAVSRVAADPARVPAAARPNPAAPWPYWRWHGAPRIYYSEYPDMALHALATEVRAFGDGGSRPWVIFDNTAHGFAVSDALRLKAMFAAACAPQGTDDA